MINIDKINLIVSAKKGIDKDIVKKVNAVYWREIKSRLTNLSDMTISAKGLVNFTVSRYLIRNKIDEIIFRIRTIKNTAGFTGERKQILLNDYYDYLRKLLKQRNEVAKLYYEQRNKRIFEANSKSPAECSEDSGGISEQSEDELQFPS